MKAITCRRHGKSFFLPAFAGIILLVAYFLILTFSSSTALGKSEKLDTTPSLTLSRATAVEHGKTLITTPPWEESDVMDEGMRAVGKSEKLDTTPSLTLSRATAVEQGKTPNTTPPWEESDVMDGGMRQPSNENKTKVSRTECVVSTKSKCWKRRKLLMQLQAVELWNEVQNVGMRAFTVNSFPPDTNIYNWVIPRFKAVKYVKKNPYDKPGGLYPREYLFSQVMMPCGGEQCVVMEGGYPVFASWRARTKKCVVYSFGLGNDVQFENMMSSKGCIVEAFDPTIELRARHERIAQKFRLRFNFAGLRGSRDSDEDLQEQQIKSNYGAVNTSVLKDLQTFMQERNHERLEVLKIDCDGCEWGVFESIDAEFLGSHVQKVYIEVHYISHDTMLKEEPKVYNFWRVMLWNFRLFYRHVVAKHRMVFAMQKKIKNWQHFIYPHFVEYAFVNINEIKQNNLRNKTRPGIPYVP